MHSVPHLWTIHPISSLQKWEEEEEEEEKKTKKQVLYGCTLYSLCSAYRTIGM